MKSRPFKTVWNGPATDPLGAPLAGVLIVAMASLENFRLTVFRKVAEQLSFRKAAEELYLTQPAVSLQIKALEEELGAVLFDRSGSQSEADFRRYYAAGVCRA